MDGSTTWFLRRHHRVIRLPDEWPADQHVQLMTDRFVIRTPRVEDVDARVLSWFQDRAYQRSFPGERHPSTEAEARAFLTDQTKRWRRILIVTHAETPIGIFWVDILNLTLVVTHHYIGDRSWWGKGVIYEARAAVMNGLFGLGAFKIVGKPNAEKRAVTQTYRDQGFKEEGLLRRERANLDGTRSDIMYFGLLAQEWDYEKARTIPEKIRRRLERSGTPIESRGTQPVDDPQFVFLNANDHQRTRKTGEMLLIDGIQNVTMSNGLVRLQVVQTGADGKPKAVEEIAIPASQYGTVVTALQQAGKNLQQKMQEQQKQQTGQQQPAAASQQADDNFDFSNP